MPNELNPDIPLCITKKFHLNVLREGSGEILFNRIVYTEENDIVDINCHVYWRLTRNESAME